MSGPNTAEKGERWELDGHHDMSDDSADYDARLERIKEAHQPMLYEYETDQTYCASADGPTEYCDTCYLIATYVTPPGRGAHMTESDAPDVCDRDHLIRDCPRLTKTSTLPSADPIVQGDGPSW